MLAETTIYSRLSDIFHNVFDDDSIVVSSALSAQDVDGWDSLTHIRLLTTVERAFGMKFSTSEISRLQDVGDMVALIKLKAPG